MSNATGSRAQKACPIESTQQGIDFIGTEPHVDSAEMNSVVTVDNLAALGVAVDDYGPCRVTLAQFFPESVMLS